MKRNVQTQRNANDASNDDEQRRWWYSLRTTSKDISTPCVDIQAAVRTYVQLHWATRTITLILILATGYTCREKLLQW